MIYTLCWVEELYSQVDRKNYRKREWLSFQNKEDMYEFINTNSIDDYKITVDIEELTKVKNEKLVLETQLEAIKEFFDKIYIKVGE